MKEKSHPILIIIIIILGIAFCSALFAVISQNLRAPSTEVSEPTTPAIPGESKPYNFDYSWTDSSPYIAHALGGIFGSNYSNSYEGFLLNYELGQRLFEADFNLTEDGDVVLLHTEEEWKNRLTSNNRPLTTENFLSALYDNKFHTMDYRTLIDLMISHPDVYLITDSKYLDQANITKEFTQIVAYAKEKDPSVLNRFVIQIYYPEMLNYIMEVYPWKSVIYTLYQNPDWTPESVANFAKESGVKVITIHYSLITPEIAKLWNDADLTVAAFTVNDLSAVNQLRQDYNVKLFYTDYLLPYTFSR